MTNVSQPLTTAQAAQVLGVSVRTVSRLVAGGKLHPTVRIIGGQRGRPLAFLFDSRDVENLKLRRQLQQAAS